MAQTTGAITFANCKILISATSAFPTSSLDVSGVANNLTLSGGELNMVEGFTFGTNTPIIAAGKRAALELAMKVYYSEIAGDGFSTLATWYEAQTPVYVQYTPKGSGVGAFVFTSGAGYITTPVYPGGDSEGKEFATFETKVKVQSITRSTAAA